MQNFIPPTNGNGEKTRRIVFDYITFALAVIGAITAAVLFITQPNAKFEKDIALIQQEVSIIKTNDLKHIEDRMIEIADDQRTITDEQNKIGQALIRIETLLEEHLKNN